MKHKNHTMTTCNRLNITYTSWKWLKTCSAAKFYCSLRVDCGRLFADDGASSGHDVFQLHDERDDVVATKPARWRRLQRMRALLQDAPRKPYAPVSRVVISVKNISPPGFQSADNHIRPAYYPLSKKPIFITVCNISSVFYIALVLHFVLGQIVSDDLG